MPGLITEWAHALNSVVNKADALPDGRLAGVGLHLTSLPGPHGIGDIADSALRFLDVLSRMKISVWQFLPTGPTAYGDSPYQPLSAFAGNEMLVGIDPLVREGLLAVNEVDSLARLPTGHVDYGELIPRKQVLLSTAAERFDERAGAGLKLAYDEFRHASDRQWLDDYALYRVLKTRHGERPWIEWENAYQRHEPAALLELRDRERSAIEQVKIKQFFFDCQWRALRQYAGEKNVRLFGDMPIYIALDSADAWAHPEILLVDETGQPSHVAGVPPDYFSADGQLWGNPLYDWPFHEASGYQWWIARMRHAMEGLDLVRIDHFRGFESFWAVPHDAPTARDGEWLPGPGDGLFEALSAALGHLPVVAEDLGLITPAVEDLRDRHGFPGMQVLQFKVGETDFSPKSIPHNCVCYTGTHDNDTTLGWFNGGGDDTRSTGEIHQARHNTLALTGGRAENVHLDMVRLAFKSPARLAIAPMQDFLGFGSEARLNIPGTTMNNWRWRVRNDQLSLELCESVAEMVEESSRI